MKRRSTKTAAVAEAPELDQVDDALDGLALVVECERHAFRRWTSPGPRGGRPRRQACPACRRERQGLSAAERAAARRRSLCGEPARHADEAT
jgi:hypothetical protein